MNSPCIPAPPPPQPPPPFKTFLLRKKAENQQCGMMNEFYLVFQYEILKFPIMNADIFYNKKQLKQKMR